MQKITVDELFKLLHNEGRFFSVTFERRTDSQRRFQLAGDHRTMLCKTGMTKYTKGLVPKSVRDAEDFRHGILTVFDINAYRRNKKRGMADFDAGFNAWRRIDLTNVKALSLVSKRRLPPTIHNELHQITNTFRLAHMPQPA